MLGRTSSGPVAVDLTRAPHLLLAGREGAGKTSALRTILVSLLMRAMPEDLRLALVDTSGDDLSTYERLPHVVRPPATDATGAVGLLTGLREEMHRRYDDLRSAACRNVDDYNQAVWEGKAPSPVRRIGAADHPHPRLLVVVTELADLTRQGRSLVVAEALAELAQLGRAAGIHLVLATADPSAPVLTPGVRADIPVRLALALSSAAESELMLDQGGAERLYGEGDALLLPRGSTTSFRMRCAHVSDQEAKAVVAHWVAG